MDVITDDSVFLFRAIIAKSSWMNTLIRVKNRSLSCSEYKGANIWTDTVNKLSQKRITKKCSRRVCTKMVSTIPPKMNKTVYQTLESQRRFSARLFDTDSIRHHWLFVFFCSNTVELATHSQIGIFLIRKKESAGDGMWASFFESGATLFLGTWHLVSHCYNQKYSV